MEVVRMYKNPKPAECMSVLISNVTNKRPVWDEKVDLRGSEGLKQAKIAPKSIHTPRCFVTMGNTFLTGILFNFRHIGEITI